MNTISKALDENSLNKYQIPYTLDNEVYLLHILRSPVCDPFNSIEI